MLNLEVDLHLELDNIEFELHSQLDLDPDPELDDICSTSIYFRFIYLSYLNKKYSIKVNYVEVYSK